MSSIFIIDDDAIHQKIAQIMVEKHTNFERHTSFSDARDALAFIRANPHSPDIPDVILLDLNMPFMDGWGFLAEFDQLKNTINKKTRIYVVTSSVDDNDRLRATAYSSVSGFISKPLSPEVVKNIIAQ